MEFICVFSVGGSLASYQVQSSTNHRYTANLRTAQGGRSDIPSTLTLEKTAAGWHGTPPHEEILRNLVYAIEAQDTTGG